VAEIRPFRGLRYHLPASEIGRSIAPPYDVISPQLQDALYASGPHNVVRIEYGREEGDARYQVAAETLRRWRDAGVLVPEPAPALYLYEQEFTHDGRSYRRRGVLGRVRLEPFESGVIRPHELTMAPAKADRLALLRATRTNVSPILALVDDADGAFARALEAVSAHPVVDAEDIAGQRHRLTVIDDPTLIARLRDALAGRPLTIADGHHRYETALAYLAERRATAGAWTGEEPENFVLMAVTSTADPGLLILPIHRLVRPRTLPPDPVAALREAFDVEDAGALADASARDRLLRLLAEAGRRTTAFGAAGLAPGRLHLLTVRERAAVERRMPPGHPPAWRALDVNVLQYGVLEPLLGIDGATIAAGEHVRYTENAAEALDAVAAGAVPLAFLVNPTRAEQVIAVAAAGDRMPQKSTFFYPKLGTGLVLGAHDV
jgi:uncharacterized protein (DUF1015 family)